MARCTNNTKKLICFRVCPGWVNHVEAEAFFERDFEVDDGDPGIIIGTGLASPVLNWKQARKLADWITSRCDEAEKENQK